MQGPQLNELEIKNIVAGSMPLGVRFTMELKHKACSVALTFPDYLDADARMACVAHVAAHVSEEINPGGFSLTVLEAEPDTRTKVAPLCGHCGHNGHDTPALLEKLHIGGPYAKKALCEAFFEASLVQRMIAQNELLAEACMPARHEGLTLMADIPGYLAQGGELKPAHYSVPLDIACSGASMTAARAFMFEHHGCTASFVYECEPGTVMLAYAGDIAEEHARAWLVIKFPRKKVDLRKLGPIELETIALETRAHNPYFFPKGRA